MTWAVVFTQCAATKVMHIALVMAPTGLPLDAPKYDLICRARIE
jgi:hypothetical protein